MARTKILLKRDLSDVTINNPSVGQTLVFQADNTMINGGSSIGLDGWVNPQETWTYASASTFTISGDKTAIYVKGLKIKLTNDSTTKYFYVISSSYSAPNTTVTVYAGTTYTLANATITNNYYSYVENPIGFPDWFAYTPTWTGFSAPPQSGVYTFNVRGRMCTLVISSSENGTSDNTMLTLTLPIQAATRTNMTWGVASHYAVDNGAMRTVPAKAIIASAGTVATCYKDYTELPWTAMNGKRCNFTIIYEI